MFIIIFYYQPNFWLRSLEKSSQISAQQTLPLSSSTSSLLFTFARLLCEPELECFELEPGGIEHFISSVGIAEQRPSFLELNACARLGLCRGPGDATT
jgi:hypothetical protein